MASDQDTIDRLESANSQLQAQNAAISEQLKQAGGFRQEAIAGRETITSLQASLADRESSLLTTIRDLSEARSQVQSLQGQSGSNDAIVSAAKDLARSLQVLLKA